MCASVRPSDDVLGAFSVAEPAIAIFYGGTGHRDHELLFTGQGRAAAGGAARADHLLFSTVTFLLYTFQ